MKTSEVYQLAHKVLSEYNDGKHAPYICYKLTHLNLRGQITDEERFRAQKIIGDLLGVGTVEMWLYIRGLLPSPWFGELSLDMREQVILYRLRWLEALIAEFQAKGD